MNLKKIKLLSIFAIVSIMIAGCRITIIPDIGYDVSINNYLNTGNIAATSNEIATGDISVIEFDTSEERQEAETGREAAVLADVFAEHNMKVGTCLSPQMLNNNAAEQLILQQYNSITMENAMKPDYILNKAESVKAGDIVVEMNKDVIHMLDWAKANNIAVRGHTLIWHSQTPDWIFYENFDTSKEMVSRDVMLSRMESYIRQVFDWIEDNGYGDVFYAYDVVNEAWMEDGSMRDSSWHAVIGDDYLWYAFNYARMYAPKNIKLYYNDYNEQYKSKTLVKFVSTLVDAEGNSLIDGIGLQAHLYTGDNLKTYFRAVDELAETGLELEITELDVALGAWQNTLPASDKNLKDQGDFYYDLINGIFERVDAGSINMDALTFWGFCDSMSWRSEGYPLLFDASFNPKYSYYGALQQR